MDFDTAAKRLQQDQKSAYNRSRASRSARSASAKSKKEAQAARTKAEKRLQQKKIENERNAQIVDKVLTSIGRIERQLGVANVGSPIIENQQQPQTTSTISSSTTSLFTNINPLSNGWSFKATSIHGDGDKIALPPSILETMTSSSNDLDPFGSSSNGGRPIAFRIGILKPDYTFPSSSKMKALIENIKENIVQNEKKKKNDVLSSQQSTSSITDNDTTNQQDMDDSDDEMDDDDDDSQIVEAYLDELSMKYISYTHGTVVEFTQEDNCVGLPESIARALLQPNSHSLVESSLNGDKEKKIDIPVRRTVDPAASTTKTNPIEMNEDDNDDMDVENNQHTMIEEDDDDGEKTPGHPAYGLFDIPSSSIEVTPISRLPAGTNCTFTPTKTSIENGFYSLKDIKVVLEQSLMRTRATLSRGDVIRTWRRGTSFDLIVSSLSPAQFGAVSCINTNLNVHFASLENDDMKDEPLAEDNVKPEPVGSRILGTGSGRLLSEPAQPQESKSIETTSSKSQVIELPPEPANDIKEGVCTIQVRGRTPSGNTVTGRRRFVCTTSTLSHLFSFASHVCDGADPTIFRLVTRFPRRELQLTTMNENKTLESLDISQGQESFIVEF